MKLDRLVHHNWSRTIYVIFEGHRTLLSLSCFDFKITYRVIIQGACVFVQLFYWQHKCIDIHHFDGKFTLSALNLINTKVAQFPSVSYPLCLSRNLHLRDPNGPWWTEGPRKRKIYQFQSALIFHFSNSTGPATKKQCFSCRDHPSG